MSSRLPTRRVQRFRPTRRELLQIAQVSGVAAAAAGLPLIGLDASDSRARRGVCRMCTMHCGVVVTTRGDRLERVEGDPSSATKSFLCLNGQALPEVVHSRDRVRRPLERSGGSFREVSWDRALSAIAEGVRDVERRHGARALAVQTGWPFVRSPLIGLLHRFCQAFGTPNLATTATLCEAAGRMGRTIVTGSDFRPRLAGCRTLVVWGANPTLSAPPFAHAVAAMALRGKNLIVIDPIRTELARAATLHLPVRPGTDGALALGLIHVVVREALFDRDVAGSASVGFEPLAVLAERFPPAEVERIAGVPAGDVERAARLFAEHGPAQVWSGLGVEHHENGVQTVRAIASLQALCGTLGAPGGPVLETRPGAAGQPLPWQWRMETQQPVPRPVEERPIGWSEHPLFHVHNRQAQGNLLARAIEDGRPYPVRALVLFGCNPLVTYPGSARLRRAFDRLDVLVTVDPFLTATAERSDFVLPASTFAEAGEALVGEQHGSRPDHEILFGLARALGLGRFFPWATLREALGAPRVPYMADPDHTIRSDPGATAARFATPSGRIELQSETVRRFGHDALPVWRPPSARPTDEYPLWLVSGPRTRAYINSQFRSIPSIAAKMPEPLAELHPSVAARLGLASGERVAVVSPHGRIELRARLTDHVRPDVVVVPSGWPEANANLLTDPAALDPISGFPALRSAVCRVERAG